MSMISQVSQAKGLEAIEEDNDEMYDERGRTIGVDNVDYDFLPGYDHLTSLDGLKPDTHFDSEPTDTPTIVSRTITLVIANSAHCLESFVHFGWHQRSSI